MLKVYLHYMHSIIHNMFSANICVVIMFIGINLLANNVSITESVKCYICDEKNCSDFKPTNQHLFVTECLDNESCVTHKCGNDIIERYCDTYREKQCHIVNDIEYCYCSEDLCNGVNVNNTTYIPPTFTNSPESDDEDDEIEEGSGRGTQHNHISDVETTKPKASGVAALRSITILICNFIWLI